MLADLFVASFLTLLFLPSVYALWHRKRLGERAILPLFISVYRRNETDVRERILVTAEQLFRGIGYQKTTVADTVMSAASAANEQRVPRHEVKFWQRCVAASDAADTKRTQ
jgi:hypothetical protein